MCDTKRPVTDVLSEGNDPEGGRGVSCHRRSQNEVTFTLIPTHLVSKSLELLTQHDFSKLSGQPFPLCKFPALRVASAKCSAISPASPPLGNQLPPFHRHGYRLPPLTPADLTIPRSHLRAQSWGDQESLRQGPREETSENSGGKPAEKSLQTPQARGRNSNPEVWRRLGLKVRGGIPEGCGRDRPAAAVRTCSYLALLARGTGLRIYMAEFVLTGTPITPFHPPN